MQNKSQGKASVEFCVSTQSWNHNKIEYIQTQIMSYFKRQLARYTQMWPILKKYTWLDIKVNYCSLMVFSFPNCPYCSLWSTFLFHLHLILFLVPVNILYNSLHELNQIDTDLRNISPVAIDLTHFHTNP